MRISRPRLSVEQREAITNPTFHGDASEVFSTQKFPEEE
jgi:hypothetical protein